MLILARIMVWVSVAVTVVSLGVLISQVTSGGGWSWAFPCAMWGCGIFLWRNAVARELRYRDYITDYYTNV